MYYSVWCYFLLLLLMFNFGSGLVVGAPSKVTLTTGVVEGIKSSKLLVIISHPPPLHVAAAAAPPQVITTAVAHVLAHPAVSTTSIQAVHNSDPIEPKVTHTITEIHHPVPFAAVHHHVLPHPASTVNGHSLGYASTLHIYKGYISPIPAHESIYTLHVGGFGVGLHIGGHGHGHGYFAVL